MPSLTDVKLTCGRRLFFGTMDPALRPQLLHLILLTYEGKFPQTMGIYSRDGADAPLQLYLEATCRDSSDGAALLEPEGFFLGFDDDLPVDIGLAMSVIPPILLPLEFGVTIEIRPRLWTRREALELA
jgi:hypothetical protein